MNPLLLLVGMVVVVSGGPVPAGTPKEPVLVRNLDKDLEVQIVRGDEGNYGVRVFKTTDQRPILLPTQEYPVPPEWRAPGKEAARVLHAELLSSGDVVIVLYSHEEGLDLIVLPKEFFLPLEVTTNSAIVFPKVKVPWHPTVSSPPETWSWSSDNVEYVTPSSVLHPRDGAPEKSIVLPSSQEGSA